MPVAEHLDGMAEAHPLGAHHPVDGRATRLARPHAVPEVLRRRDHQGRGCRRRGTGSIRPDRPRPSSAPPRSGSPARPGPLPFSAARSPHLRCGPRAPPPKNFQVAILPLLRYGILSHSHALQDGQLVHVEGDGRWAHNGTSPPIDAARRTGPEPWPSGNASGSPQGSRLVQAELAEADRQPTPSPSSSTRPAEIARRSNALIRLARRLRRASTTSLPTKIPRPSYEAHDAPRQLGGRSQNRRRTHPKPTLKSPSRSPSPSSPDADVVLTTGNIARAPEGGASGAALRFGVRDRVRNRGPAARYPGCSRGTGNAPGCVSVRALDTAL